MIRHWGFAIALGGAALALGADQRAVLPAGSALTFEEPHVQFDDRYQGAVIEHRWTFTNESDQTIHVTGVRASVGVPDATVTPETLSPGQSGEFLVRQDLGMRLGKVAYRYVVRTDESGGRRHRVSLSGFVQSAYDPELLSVEFGEVDGLTGGSAEAVIASREVDRLEFLGVVDAPPYLQVTVPDRAGASGEGLLVLFSLDPAAPPGYLAGKVRLRTNVPHQPYAIAVFYAMVVGRVAPSENPVDLGVIDVGSTLHKEVLLLSRDGEPFEVDRVEDSAEILDVSVVACDGDGSGAGPPCRRLDISLDATVRKPLSGQLKVWLVGADDPITLSYRGIVVTPGTEIRELTMPTPAGEEGS